MGLGARVRRCPVGQGDVFIVGGPKLLKGQRPILAPAEEKPPMVVVAVQGAPSPQHPAPCAHGSPGFSPSLAPSPSPSCTCHSTSWASCWLHLTWDSSPLRTLPHTLSSASPPFIFSTALPLELKEQVSACDDCS